MPIREYVVRQWRGIWGVWLGGHLVSSHPTQREALVMGHAFANGASARGEPSTLRLEGSDGLSVDYPIFRPPPPANTE